MRFIVPSAHVAQDNGVEERRGRDPRNAQMHRHEREVDEVGRYPDTHVCDHVISEILCVVREREDHWVGVTPGKNSAQVNPTCNPTQRRIYPT